jgi:hypothetical protein
VAHTGKERNAYSFSWGKLRAGDHLEDLGIDECIILKRILKKEDGTL